MLQEETHQHRAVREVFLLSTTHQADTDAPREWPADQQQEGPASMVEC